MMTPMKVFLLLLAAAILPPGEPKSVSKLPEPGTWVKYQLTVERVEDPNQLPVPAIELTCKFLERTKEDGEDYDRLEMVMTIHQPGQEKAVEDCVQFLIRETALKKCEVAASDIKECLRRRGDGPVQNWLDRLEGDRLNESVGPVLLLSGVSADHQDAQQLTGEEKTVKWQRGELASDRWVVVPMFEKQTDPLKKKRVLLKMLLHEKVPTHVLFAILEEQESTRPTADAEWSEDRAKSIYHHTLIDFGTGAKSLLPEDK